MTPASAVDICRALVACPSVTPRDEGALDTLGGLLRTAGFATERVDFCEPGTPDIGNLYARVGTEPPFLVFAGHTDVVPPGDTAHWRFPPFSGEVAEGMIWGRGAVDMKGAIAAALAACFAYFAGHGKPKGSIGFLVTGDEEGPAVNGMVKLLDWAHRRGERFDHCILGEPTNRDQLGDTIKIGRRGSLTGRLAVHGKQGHVGYPQLADNPVHHMLRLAGALLAGPLDAGSAHFEASNLEITSIDVGNGAVNVIPAEARAIFNIRFNDLWSPATLSAEIRARIERAAAGARFTLTFEPTNAEAFLTEPGPFVGLVAEAVEAETGRRPTLSTSGGTSDARFIKAYCPVVEFGLVGQTMHAIDERVALADLDRLARIYERVLDVYFG
jgi:succinyl-diaminopimelate desuccinylase